MVNVDFEWFDPNPEVDFHGLKTLLRQLLDVTTSCLIFLSLQTSYCRSRYWAVL